MKTDPATTCKRSFMGRFLTLMPYVTVSVGWMKCRQAICTWYHTYCEAITCRSVVRATDISKKIEDRVSEDWQAYSLPHKRTGTKTHFMDHLWCWLATVWQILFGFSRTWNTYADRNTYRRFHWNVHQTENKIFQYQQWNSKERDHSVLIQPL